MPNRHYVCAKCGELRRRPAVYARERHTESPEWPRCCEAPMTVLTFIQAEAATKLTAGDRLEWIAKGLHVVRGAGRRRWTAAMTDRAIEESGRQVAAVNESANKRKC